MNPYEAYMYQVKEAAIAAEDAARFLRHHITRHSDVLSQSLGDRRFSGAVDAMSRLGSEHGSKAVHVAFHPDKVKALELSGTHEESLANVHRAYTASVPKQSAPIQQATPTQSATPTGRHVDLPPFMGRGR